MFWDTFYKIFEANHTKPNTVAKVIGVSSATCTKWKNGTVPNGDTLLKLADCLGCSVDYLLGRTDKPEETESTLSVSGNQQYPTEHAWELDNEISTLLLRLSLRERVKLMSMIYKYVDEHKKCDIVSKMRYY